jgi:hypothetical protein
MGLLARRRAARAIVACAVLAAAACGPGGLLGKKYEYEEDLAIALDGSATLTINASIAALVALRGLDLDVKSTRVDRDRIRAAYESPVTDVTRVSRPWRRAGRPFVQIRVEIADVRKLGVARPLAWSQYELAARDGESVYRQTVGASALRPGTLTNVGWDGSEIVAFRVHLPARIIWHNARDLETDETEEVSRGNILAWEQHLADRLDGRPLVMEVRMENQSILYRTLWLFAGAFAAAVAVLGALIWWTMRRGAKERVSVPPV